jgi:hypothetical protein
VTRARRVTPLEGLRSKQHHETRFAQVNGGFRLDCLDHRQTQSAGRPWHHKEMACILLGLREMALSEMPRLSV